MDVYGMVMKRFQAPMAALSDGTHIFVRDCILFEHDQLGTTKAVIVKFYQKVFTVVHFCMSH